MQIGWIEEQLDELPVSTRMQRWALQALRDDLWRARRELARSARSATAPGAPVEDAVERFVEAHPRRARSASPTWRARWRGRAAPTSPASPWPSGSCARSRTESRARAAAARARRSRGPIGPARSSPPHSATRSRIPTSPCPPPTRPWAGGRRRDAVGDLDLEHLRRPAQDDPRPAAAAVLERVGQALLHEPEGGQVDAGRERPGSPSTLQLDRRARRRASARSSAPRRSSEGCGEWSASSPSGRRMPSSRRISVSASRPVASTAPSARDRGRRGRGRARCAPRRPGRP